MEEKYSENLLVLFNSEKESKKICAALTIIFALLGLISLGVAFVFLSLYPFFIWVPVGMLALSATASAAGRGYYMSELGVVKRESFWWVFRSVSYSYFLPNVFFVKYKGKKYTYDIHWEENRITNLILTRDMVHQLTFFLTLEIRTKGEDALAQSFDIETHKELGNIGMLGFVRLQKPEDVSEKVLTHIDLQKAAS